MWYYSTCFHYNFSSLILNRFKRGWVIICFVLLFEMWIFLCEQSIHPFGYKLNTVLLILSFCVKSFRLYFIINFYWWWRTRSWFKWERTIENIFKDVSTNNIPLDAEYYNRKICWHQFLLLWYLWLIEYCYFFAFWNNTNVL